MTATLQPHTKELWDALLSCDPNAIQDVLTRAKGKIKEGCETLVPSNFLWHSEIKDELSVLHYVAMIGDVDLLYDIIWRSKGLNLNVKSACFKWTPMQYAIYGGHVNVVKLLLGNGANVNVQDSDGVSGLHLAVSNANLSLVDILIKHGAKVNLQDKKGDTPLHFCLGLLSSASKGIPTKERAKVTERLLVAGASVKLMNNLGDTAMHFCLRHHHGATFCRLLLGRPGGIECLSIINDMGHIPLQVAEDPETLELLLLQGSCINFQGPDGRSALHMRARRPELVTLLLDYKADVNQVDHQGRTALHVALSDELVPLESVCHLAMSMGDVNIKDNSGNTPLHLACRLQRLLAAGGAPDPVIDLLVNQGALVNLRNKAGETPLFIAVRHAHYPQARELLVSGASPHIPDNRGLAPTALDPKWAARVVPDRLTKDRAVSSRRVRTNDKMGTSNLEVAGDTTQESQKASTSGAERQEARRKGEILNEGVKPVVKAAPSPNLDQIWTTNNSGQIHPHRSSVKSDSKPQSQLPVTVQTTPRRQVKTVRRQLASLQDEVSSFRSMLEKCADPESEIGEEELLSLIQDEPAMKPNDNVSEDFSYLRKEVVSLAKELEDAFLDS